MKFTMKLLSMLFAVLLLANVANADSPREQLDQKVMQLQKNPTDNALRENIIHLAQTLKPAPAIPEEARRHFVKAVTLQKEAKSAEDYDLPIQEYRQALLVAPWWSDAYFDLASALELKQQYADAIQNLKLSILASPDGPDARAAQDKVYALEAKSEKQKKAESEQEVLAKKNSSVEGYWKENNLTDIATLFKIAKGANGDLTLKEITYADELHGGVTILDDKTVKIVNYGPFSRGYGRENFHYTGLCNRVSEKKLECDFVDPGTGSHSSRFFLKCDGANHVGNNQYGRPLWHCE